MGGPLGTGNPTSAAHSHTRTAPRGPSGVQRCLRDGRVPNRRRRVYVGVMKAKAKTPLGGRPQREPLRILPCQAGRLSVAGGAVGSRTRGTPASGTGAVAHRSDAHCPPRLKCAGAWRGRAGVTEARGPIGPRHRWSLWIVGRWPVLIPRFPGGAAPREPPFVGVSAGPDPPPEARMPQATQRSQGRTGGIPCVRTGV